MSDFISQVSRFDAWQGRSERQSEAYMKYGERAAQFLTKPGAKSDGGVAGSAGKQAGAARRL